MYRDGAKHLGVTSSKASLWLESWNNYLSNSVTIFKKIDVRIGYLDYDFENILGFSPSQRGFTWAIQGLAFRTSGVDLRIPFHIGINKREYPFSVSYYNIQHDVHNTLCPNPIGQMSRLYELGLGSVTMLPIEKQVHPSFNTWKTSWQRVTKFRLVRPISLELNF